MTGNGSEALYRLIGPDGAQVGVPRHHPPQGLALELYGWMRRVRSLDERLLGLQRQGRIGFYGPCTGQEATPIAAGLALAPGDWVFPALRESSILLLRGMPLETYVAQLFGNSADVLKGRQMPSHQASRAARQVSWSSCIATQLPQAVGAAHAARLRGSGDVMLAFLGEGATSHPDFHAALNWAGIFRAPVVFVCQNNQYALSVPAARQTASASFAIKALGYGLPGERVDGNDALAVYDAVFDALTRARSGAGATLIEAVTYRLGPHSSSDDPTRYRDPVELEQYLELDPLLRLARYLARDLGRAELEQRERELDAALDTEFTPLLARLERTPPPAPDSLFDDVFAELPKHLREQREELRRALGRPTGS